MKLLNKLTPAKLSPHHIEKGMVLMLMQNLSPKQGLCNGTRIVLNKATNMLLYCKIASGDYAGEEVLIPTTEMKHQGEQFIEWNRRQFPVRPALAITINKNQGQTLKQVGVWLEEPIFTHGQLNVAASMVGDPQHLYFTANKSASRKTRNDAYK